MVIENNINNPIMKLWAGPCLNKNKCDVNKDNGIKSTMDNLEQLLPKNCKVIREQGPSLLSLYEARCTNLKDSSQFIVQTKSNHPLDRWIKIFNSAKNTDEIPLYQFTCSACVIKDIDTCDEQWQCTLEDNKKTLVKIIKGEEAAMKPTMEVFKDAINRGYIMPPAPLAEEPPRLVPLIKESEPIQNEPFDERIPMLILAITIGALALVAISICKGLTATGKPKENSKIK